MVGPVFAAPLASNAPGALRRSPSPWRAVSLNPNFGQPPAPTVDAIRATSKGWNSYTSVDANRHDVKGHGKGHGAITTATTRIPAAASATNRAPGAWGCTPFPLRPPHPTERRLRAPHRCTSWAKTTNRRARTGPTQFLPTAKLIDWRNRWSSWTRPYPLRFQQPCSATPYGLGVDSGRRRV